MGLSPRRRPGTQSVCLRQDRGSNRPEKWLNRFLVAEQSGTVWADEADVNLIPGFNTDSVFPPIFPFFSPTVHDYGSGTGSGLSPLVEQGY